MFELLNLKDKLMGETQFWRQILMINGIYTYKFTLIVAFILHQIVRYNPVWGSYCLLEGDDPENAVWEYKPEDSIMEECFDDAIMIYLENLRRKVKSENGIKIIENIIEKWNYKYTNKFVILNKTRFLLYENNIKLPHDKKRIFGDHSLKEVDEYLIILENKYNKNIINKFIEFNIKKDDIGNKLDINNIYKLLIYQYPSKFFKNPTKKDLEEELKNHFILPNKDG